MSCSRLFCLFLLLMAIFPSCDSGASTARSARPGSPNVIFIVFDTTSGERCSVNGYARKTTPFLEKLSGEAINFRNTWSPSGWTPPAHASMFTGLRPEHHGLHYGNRLFLWEDATTLAEHLQGAGYRTSCFSNNPLVSPDQGLIQGFDQFVPLYENQDLPYPTAIATYEMALAWSRGDEHDDAPFFLFINNLEPHQYYTPPLPYADRFVGPGLGEKAIAAGLLVTPEVLLRHNLGVELAPAYARQVIPDLYDAEIACLDHETGRFIAALEAEGLLDNTLLVITSDHGENLGRHGQLEHTFGLYREVLHVPLVIRLPDGARAGEVRDEVVRLEDLFPTILEVCGLPIPAGIDGETLLGDVSGRVARAMRGYPEKFLNDMEKAMGGRKGYDKVMVDLTSEFDGRHHRIRYSDGRSLVFDVIEDPEELHAAED